MAKAIIIVIIVLILLGLFYWFYLKEEQEEPVDLDILFNGLEEETGINFSKKEPATFWWNSRIDPDVRKELVDGFRISAENLSGETPSKIELYLEDNGFIVDQNNILSGRVSGLAGYKSGSGVCLIAIGFSGYKEAENISKWAPKNTNAKDVDIQCGNL